MSAPTPAPGDDRPREGYYPDPSIPGYVRYWNGASWVPGTSRPAPKDGEPLIPPPGVRPATPAAAAPSAVEETGPYFFDEDPQPSPSGPGTAAPGGPYTGQAGTGGDGRTAWGVDPRVPAARPGGQGAHTDGTPTATPPSAEEAAADPGGTFIFRRPVPGPAAVTDEGTMTFRPVPGQGRPGGPPSAAGPQDAGARSGFGPHDPAQGQGFGAHASGSGAGTGGPGAAGPGAGPAGAPATPGGFGPQGPVGAPNPHSAAAPSAPQAPSPAAGPGFGAGKAAAARAAAAQTPPAVAQAPAPHAAAPAQPAPAPAAPSVPAQGGAPG
ncbi:DUF2510 domain-containing protein, partial [Streptomyces broussonetiae]